MRNLFLVLFSLFLACGLAGCGASAPTLKPFKMDIQQGNVVTSKMLLQLKPGMTKSQVRFIMGTPLIVDSFHKDRWDYFYQMRHAGKVIEQRRVILDFDKDVLARVRGDVVPQGTAGADTGDAAVSKTIVMPAKKPEEKSWTEKLKFWKKDEKTPEAKPAETKPVEAPKAALPVPAATSTEAPVDADAPSVLVLPIGVGAPTVEMLKVEVPATESPKLETPKVDMPQVERLPVESPKIEPMQVEPAPIKAAPAKFEPPKVIELPKATPPAPAPIKPVQPVPSVIQDEKMIFRMDKTLKPELIEQESAAPAPAKAAPPTKKAPEAPLPPETEPGFFDRMLEKIGF